MKKFATICLLTCTLPFMVWAQKKSDTLNLSQAITTANFYTDSVQQQVFGFAKLSSYYLNMLIPDHVSKISASYGFQRGNYIPSQGATTINAGSLSSEGSAKLGKVKLFGSFSYQKTFEDSTRFAHQTRSNTSTPFYYGSPAYVHFERSVYTFKTMAATNFLNSKMEAGLGADYKVGDHYATNDPRGSVGEYQFNLMASLAYKINENWKAGFGLRHGYGQERVNVGYKNERYYQSTFYEMYYNYLINGYGEATPSISSSNRKYTDDQNRNGLDVYLDLNTGNAGKFYLSGSYLSEDQRYYYNNDGGFTEYSTYNLASKAVNLLWLKKMNNYALSAVVKYSENYGKDLNLTYHANNYIYSSSAASAKVVLSTQSNQHSLHYYLSADKYDEERVDGIKANDIYFDNLLFTAGGGFRNNYPQQSFFGLNLSASYKMPLSDEFTVARATEGNFTRYVIYHDYLYNTSSYAGGELSAAYGKPVFKTMIAAFKLNLGYQRKLDQKTLDRTLVSIPGKDRFSAMLSLNLYF